MAIVGVLLIGAGVLAYNRGTGLFGDSRPGQSVEMMEGDMVGYLVVGGLLAVVGLIVAAVAKSPPRQ